MKSALFLAIPMALASVGASAQTANSENPAYKDSSPVQTATPAKGANSFTEDQARGRLAKAGYTGVGTLTKDDEGRWVATATKGGKSMTVALDYKGNVSAR